MPRPIFVGPVVNPFGLTSVASLAEPTLVDLDGDGDLDALVGNYDGDLTYFQNTGSAALAVFAAPVSNPFGLNNSGYFASPTLVDIDGDGDLDLFVGEYYGNTEYFENIGNASSPSFTSSVTNAFGLTSVSYSARPAFVDIDGDGDLDAFISEYYGNIKYFQNTGSASTPAFAAPVSNPFGLFNSSVYTNPTFADIDDDGDMDAFVGNDLAQIQFLENTGTANSPAFTLVSTTQIAGGFSSPVLVDIDDDGDLDLVSGDYDGNLVLFYQEQPGVTITVSGGSTDVTEGGANDTYTLVLDAPPSDDVTITLDATNGQVSTDLATVVFTDANWDNPQTVTVSAVNDALGEFIHRGVIKHTVTSTDTAYDNLPVGKVVVTITDNDLADGPNFFKLDSTNPAGLSNVGTNAAPAFADLDADGDLDAFIGDNDGNTQYFENTGSAASAAFAAAISNPFGLSDAGAAAKPYFADSDADGDLDLFIGSSNGKTEYYENIGTAALAVYASPVTNPFGLTDVGSRAAPALVDIDGDGDLDALIGSGAGLISFYENTGDASTMTFAAPVIDPFGLIDVGGSANPAFIDNDGDGDLDAMIGNSAGKFLYFENTGSASSPAFAAPVTNPFYLSDIGSNASPAFADIDADGVLDVFVGTSTGDTVLFTSDRIITIEGDANDNTIYATDADNILDGKGGLDTLRYDSAPSAITVDLAQTDFQDTGGSGLDKILDFENLYGSAFADTLTGTAGNNLLAGLNGDDSIKGGDGNDTLDGGVGADTMKGEGGDDLYYVDDVNDVIVESSAAGDDTVYVFGADYTLPNNIEQVHIKATGASNLTGSSSADIIYAGTGNNIINGAGGKDTLSYL